MAQQTHILVLENDQLLVASILSLLASRSDLEVTNSKFTSLAFLEDREGPPPDVIIIEQGHLLANMTTVVNYADLHPNLRLIVLGLSENKVTVYNKQMVEVRQVSDFLELL